KSDDQSGSLEAFTSKNAGHQGEEGMIFPSADHLFSWSALIIDPEEKYLKVEEAESAEVGSNALPNTQAPQSAINHQHIDPLEDTEQLNHVPAITESFSQHQVDNSDNLELNAKSHYDHLDNQPLDIDQLLCRG